MPRRTRRTVAIVALLVVLVVATVLVTRRFSSPRDAVSPGPTASSSVNPSAGSNPTPTYSPTDAYGSPEPGLAQSDVTTGAGGSTSGPAGLPLGYSRNPSGAAAAATNYLEWMDSLKIIDKATADAMAGAAASDARTRSALIESFDLLRGPMADLTADEQQADRGAYAIASYSGNRAVVYIWAPEVRTDRRGRTDNTWGIDAVPLVWVSNDWKLDGALVAQTGAAAVDPADPAGNPTSAEKHSILSRTPADPGTITDSADQTWLEYADAAR